MRKLIYLLALLVFFGSVPKAMALDQTSQAIDRAYKEEVAQQKKQDAKWKAFMNEGTKSVQKGQMNTTWSNQK